MVRQNKRDSGGKEQEQKGAVEGHFATFPMVIDSLDKSRQI